MIKRNISIPFKFYCITDQPELYENSIQVDNGLDLWWNKICLFKQVGQCLYFDLDVIIHGPIEQ